MPLGQLLCTTLSPSTHCNRLNYVLYSEPTFRAPQLYLFTHTLTLYSLDGCSMDVRVVCSLDVKSYFGMSTELKRDCLRKPEKSKKIQHTIYTQSLHGETG